MSREPGAVLDMLGAMDAVPIEDTPPLRAPLASRCCSDSGSQLPTAESCYWGTSRGHSLCRRKRI